MNHNVTLWVLKFSEAKWCKIVVDVEFRF